MVAWPSQPAWRCSATGGGSFPVSTLRAPPGRAACCSRLTACICAGRSPRDVLPDGRPPPAEAVASLFDPITIRGVEIPNRIVMPPMTTRLAAPDGGGTPELIPYFVARAEGGAGLITVEMCSPDPAGRHRARELGISHDRFVAGLRELTSRLKAAGSRASVQIGHAGGHTRQDVTGHPPVAPSALPHVVQEVDTRRVVPEELTPEGIRAVVQAFAEAAERAKRAGFDAVEVHGAHGYLIAQFLSPLDNRRGDEYGGSLRNRARFALEVVEACRKRVGDFPLVFRFRR